MPKPKKADLIQNTKKKSTSSLPALASGKPAKAIADYEREKSGGAAKAAAKLVPVKTQEVSKSRASTTGLYAANKEKVVVNNMKPERKVVESRIINDKAKTATRAKIQANKVLRDSSKQSSKKRS